MKRVIIISYLLMIVLSGCTTGKKITVVSPDGINQLTIQTKSHGEEGIIPFFSLQSSGKNILLPSPFKIFSSDDPRRDDYKTLKTEQTSNSGSWINKFGERNEIPDNYNEVKIFFNNNGTRVNLVCRAYNEGVAFAYEFPEQEGPDSIAVTDEKIIFRFSSDYYAWSAPRAQAQYSYVPLSKIGKECERPLVIEIDSSFVIALAEAKLVDYARMKFDADSTDGTGIRTRLGSEVKKAVPFQSPWRVVMIGQNPGDLLEKNYLLLNLNDPSRIGDILWIRPGKALREVTLTTKGARAAIDFTSSHNMQYVEFDAGWYGPENNDASDARAVNLDPARSKGPLDMKEVVKYASSKNIGILLYVNRKALEKQLDELLPIYKEWGISGLKFGFVQVGSQKVTGWLNESIRKVADYKMVVDVHDEYRPTGFQRTYPNWLTMEGIRGDEESPSNSHTLITMFTRMLAGPGDNTVCYYNERVDKKMGSHASQLAKTVCIFSPLQFLYWYDKAAPNLEKNDGLWGSTNYIGSEPELEFFNDVPTVWDETRVLYASIGNYGVIARRKGNEWFIGGINGQNQKSFKIDFSFLDPSTRYQASVYSDDPSADTRTHVRIDRLDVNNKSVYNAELKANNGFAMHIKPM